MARQLVVEIPIAAKSLADYEQFGKEMCDELRQSARELVGKKIFHINSTEKGGGVAEILKSQVALEQGLGLVSRWLVIRPSGAFFDVTKKIHHLLQGAEGQLSAEEEALYMKESEAVGRSLAQFFQENSADLLIVHDPQPFVATSGLLLPKIFRVHPDLCQPNPWIMDWLCQKMPAFQHIIISRQDCTLLCASPEAVTTIPPAIDPLMPKNVLMPMAEAKKIIRDHGIDSERPLITQVSRFDQWKDPIGVIRAYRIAKQSIPDMQLALVGFFQADDDADSMAYFKLVEDEAKGDPDIHLFSQLTQLGDIPNDVFISALQVGSDIVLQKSIKEGFGLTVTEAMWKGAAVIGGDAGGIRLQITSGINGILVHTVEETTTAIITLMADKRLRKKMGSLAHQSVQEHFLMPRFVRDNLLVYRSVLY